MEDAIRKAEVLIEALPYIKRFHKKIYQPATIQYREEKICHAE